MNSPTSPSPRLRICFINRSYWPDAEATGQLLTELCEDLGDRFDVTVIAGQPNENPDHAHYVPCGTQRRNGVTIRRVRHTRWPKGHLLGRLINYCTYLIGSAVAAFSVPRPDIVVAETDPPLLCLLAAWLGWWRGCRVVIYLQDIHPEIGIALGKLRDTWLTRWLSRQFLRAYRRADRVIVLSEDMRSLVTEWGIKSSRIEVVPNWVDSEVVYPVKSNNRFRAVNGFENQFVVMYSGNLGLCQQLDEILQAADKLKNEPHIRFVFVGSGASRSRLEHWAHERSLTNVSFFDYRPKSELADSLSAADVQLVPLDSRLTRLMMPSKLYGVLASGTPLIAVAPDDCELTQLVKSEGVGWVARPNDALALAETIRYCSQNPAEVADFGQRSRQLAVEQFDRRRITERFGQVLNEIAGLQPVAASISVSEPVNEMLVTAHAEELS